jgi:hypothetical protein
VPRCQPKGRCGACCPQQSAQFARPAYSTQLCLTPTGADLTRHSLPECCRSATMSPWSLWSTRGLRFLPRQSRGMSAPSEHQRLRSAAAISTGARTSTTSLANAASQCLSELHRSGVDAPTAGAVHPRRPHLQTAQPHQIGHETGHSVRLGHPFPKVRSAWVCLLARPGVAGATLAWKNRSQRHRCHAPVACKPQARFVLGGAGTSGGRMLLGGVTHVRVRATCVCCRPFLLPRAALFFVLIE